MTTPTNKTKNNTIPDDKIIYITNADTLIHKMRTTMESLDQAQTNDEKIKAVKKAVDVLIEKHEALRADYMDLLRASAEMIKHKAIQVPPNQPPLQTTPWKVGEPSTTITNKSELTKRTEHSVATIQKKK